MSGSGDSGERPPDPSGVGDGEGGQVVPLPRAGGGEAAEDPEAELDLGELRAALEELRAEIQGRFGSPGAARTLDWADAVDTLRRRLGTFGMSERSGDVDEFGMDEVVLQRSRRLLDFLQDRYWRVEVAGLDRVPEDGPVLFVANRSGLLPYDGLMISHVLQRARPGAPRPRFLVADWLVTMPFVQPFLARLGGVRACRENADRLLRAGHSVIAFPEGAKGATKVFRERYRLKRFGRGGVIRTAIENGVPLVPVGVVGAEEAHPVLFKSHTAGRVLGLPFLPVTPTFPWAGLLGALPAPTKWVLEFGEPVSLESALQGDPDAAHDPLLLSRLTEELRASIARLIQAGLARRESAWGA